MHHGYVTPLTGAASLRCDPPSPPAVCAAKGLTGQGAFVRWREARSSHRAHPPQRASGSSFSFAPPCRPGPRGRRKPVEAMAALGQGSALRNRQGHLRPPGTSREPSPGVSALPGGHRTATNLRPASRPIRDADSGVQISLGRNQPVRVSSRCSPCSRRAGRKPPRVCGQCPWERSARRHLPQ
jgi:hypothetical protein